MLSQAQFDEAINHLNDEIDKGNASAFTLGPDLIYAMKYVKAQITRKAPKASEDERQALRERYKRIQRVENEVKR